MAADALAGMALPVAAAQPIGEIRHPVENGVDIGHHIPSLVHDGSATWRAQGDVKHHVVKRRVQLLQSGWEREREPEGLGQRR